MQWVIKVPVRLIINCDSGEHTQNDNTGELPVRLNISCCTGENTKRTIQVPVIYNITCGIGEQVRYINIYKNCGTGEQT